jgi:hypothetical protein
MSEPFYLKPKIRVLFFYRNFAARGGKCAPCHIGLGVGCLHVIKCLRAAGIRCDLHGVWDGHDVARILTAHPDCTHAVLEAPWIGAADLAPVLLSAFPDVHFTVRCHSQIGFLQVEAGAIRMIREYLHLQESTLNFAFAGNNQRFCNYIETAYQSRCLLLPNLYDIGRVKHKPAQSHDHRVLRLASFGAIRLLKNHTTAAAAAQLIARRQHKDLEFHVSTNREEHGKGVLASLRNMFAGLHWAKLVEVPWQPWSEFRHAVAHMDLCLQVSFTETFNITTADAVAERVPSVGSSAIDWLPAQWQADTDDAEAIARVGMDLLRDPDAADVGVRALQKYLADSLVMWKNYLAA